MKVLILIVGIILILLGSAMLGEVIGLFKGDYGFSTFSDIQVAVFALVFPIVGGWFLCRWARSKRDSNRPTANQGKEKIILFGLFFGILLILFGSYISIVVSIGLFAGYSNYSVIADTIGIVLAGIGPIVGGWFLCRWARSKRDSSRPTGNKVGNDEQHLQAN